MTITYPLTLPTTKAPTRISLTQNVAVAVNRSPWTFQTKTQRFQGDSWSISISLPMMLREDAEEWICFLAKLKGPYGTFLAGDYAAKTPRGVATGTPLVKGANQTGETLITDGWTVSTTGILLAGDYIQIGNNLYKVLADANSDGSGDTTLDIFPPLRSSPADNATIIITNTVGTFRLSSTTVPLYEVSSDLIYSLSFSGVEAI